MEPRLLRRFDQHRQAGSGRVVRGRTASTDADGDVEVEAALSDEDEVEEEVAIGVVSRMAVSADGQWLATTDDLCRTHVFNLDAMQVSVWT
jgi:U3 small nucleolar RNA-associated protein 4